MMDKKLMMFCVIAIIGIFGMIRYNEPVTSGDELEMHVNMVNDYGENLEEVRVNVYIPDLGIVLPTNPSDIKDNDKIVKRIFWETGDVPTGEYLVRISASNKDIRNVKYRHIIIA